MKPLEPAWRARQRPVASAAATADVGMVFKGKDHIGLLVHALYIIIF